MRKFIYRVCHVIGNILIIRIANKIYTPPPKEKTEKEKTIEKWMNENGNMTLRLNYDLNESSVVIDLGGYQGQWTSDIYSKYNCTVKVFEPYWKYADNIRKRFKKNNKIEVFPFGLSSETKTVKLSINEDRSSIFLNSENICDIKLIKAIDFFKEQHIDFIDLMKVNIEGGEYDLLYHLIECGFIKKIKNIQIQFHDFVPNARQMMLDIQTELRKSHKLTFHYEFVWENWGF